MNEAIHPDNASAVPWPTSDDRVRVPDSSMSACSEKTPPAAAGPLKSAVQGAHDTIGRIAGSAAPAVRQLGESVAAAGETLHAKTDQLREMSLLTQAPLTGPDSMPPLPQLPVEIPPQSPQGIREPDLPGEHMPIGDGPRPATAATLDVVDGPRRGAAC